MADDTMTEQFILLPPHGIRANKPTSNPELTSFLVSLSGATRVARLRVARHGTPAEMVVLDSIHRNGAKLIEVAPQAIPDLRAQQPGMRIVPVIYYEPARAPRPKVEAKAARRLAKTLVKIVSALDGAPVVDAEVIAFTDYTNREGADGVTNGRGEVRLALGGLRAQIERLYVFPRLTYWGLLKKNVTLASGARFRLAPIDPGFVDARRHFYGDADLEMGAGIKVGVIDTGVGPHPDLRLEGGFNAVLDEDETDGHDNGDGHGTHVAGIIAGRGAIGAGVRGIAPGVTLRSYRVFGLGKPGASNFAIAKAIDRAVSDGCDLINMSLSSGVPDIAIQEAVTEARTQGTVVIVAAGNEDRSPVAFPAADSLALAVSALGRKGTFPRGASEHGDIARPFGRPDRKNFIAAFSNIGPQIDLTAPGVGIISSVPGGYAALSGTSMASPVVTGAAARLLARPQHAELRASERDQARSDAMAQIILQAASSLGFNSSFEGGGIILLS